MTGFEFGDVVLVLAVTSQQRPGMEYGEAPITAWRAGGLLKPSVFKPLIATIEQGLVRRRLGLLQGEDLETLRQLLATIIGDHGQDPP